MDRAVLHKLSAGMYIVTSCYGNKFNGQVADIVFQIASEPLLVAMAINKKNLTHEYISHSRLANISILDIDTPLKQIGQFGFKSGRDIDKFQGMNCKAGKNGVPVVLDHAVGYLETEVVNQVDAGSHTLFITRVTESEMLTDAEPMTYAYYHKIKGGKLQANAPGYVPPEKRSPPMDQTVKNQNSDDARK
ncbi:MAG: flavin reductase family protein [Thermoplasmata archaeon]